MDAPQTRQAAAPPPAAEQQPKADTAGHTRAFSGEEYLAISDELARQRARAKEADEQFGATALPSKEQKTDLQALVAQVRIEMEAKMRAQDEQARAPVQGAHTPDEQAGGRAERERAPAGRLRQASMVVFDEAQDDPALRFVLVAAVLFVLFLFILLLSHLLG